MAEVIQTVDKTPVAAPGSTGLGTQLPGQAATVDGMAAATGGVGPGELMEVDIDAELAKFESDDTPLCSLMLAAKKVDVNSPRVQHYQMDEEVSTVTTTAAVAKGTAASFVLSLSEEDKSYVQTYSTLRVRGVNGYTEDGSKEDAGSDLQLYVTGRDASDNPIVRCVNGPRQSPTNEYCQTPAIPKGTKIDILATALHETQKVVPPDTFVPVPILVTLQKRGMTRVVSDYFDSQKKRIPFTNALLAEYAIRKFKHATNRSLWIGRGGKMPVKDDKTGTQMVYFMTGIRWSFKREMEHTGKWEYEDFVGLGKLFYTGADVPKGAICLCGKNFLENIQCIDFSKHPEVQIKVETNTLGWSITRFHTVFGDFDFKHDPTLDRIGYSNSAAILGIDRLVHYVRSAEHTDTENVEEHEAKRETLIVWDALALKGACHIFINGEGTPKAVGATSYTVWKTNQAPTGADLVDGKVYYLLVDCPGINAKAHKGETWIYKSAGGTGSWEKYEGELDL